MLKLNKKNPCWKVKWQLLQTSLNRLNYKRITKYYPNFHCLSLAATCFFLCFDEYFDKKFEFPAKTLPGLFTKQRWLCRFWKKKWLNIKKCCQAIKTTLKKLKIHPLILEGMMSLIAGIVKMLLAAKKNGSFKNNPKKKRNPPWFSTVVTQNYYKTSPIRLCYNHHFFT